METYSYTLFFPIKTGFYYLFLFTFTAIGPF